MAANQSWSRTKSLPSDLSGRAGLWARKLKGESAVNCVLGFGTAENLLAGLQTRRSSSTDSSLQKIRPQASLLEGEFLAE